MSARLGPIGYRVALALMRVWWVVARPRSSGVRCVVRCGNRFVLVRHSYGERGWMLPGGRCRGGEHPLDTARREMAQELGVVCTEWKELGVVRARRSYRRRRPGLEFRRHTTYYLEGHTTSTVLEPRAAELADAGWFTATALPEDRSDSIGFAVTAGWLPGHPAARSEG